MTKKDAAVYKVLAELNLVKPLSPSEHLSEAFRIMRQTEEENYLEDVAKLFQTPLNEMAFLSGITFPEYTPEKIASAIEYARDAKEITKLEEGGRFSLYKKDDFYILRDGDGKTTYGWAQILNRALHGRNYNYIHVFYILPQFRKTGAGLVLFHAIKETVAGHILIDGPIFPKGEEFIDSLAKKGIYTMWAANKKTGERTEYTPGIITHKNIYAVIIESTKDGLYGQYLPGSNEKTYFARYSEVVLD